MRVVATASPAQHDLLRELGATPVDYGNGLADRVRTAAPRGVDVAVDTVGTDEAIDVSTELVADRNRIVAAARGLALGIRVIGGSPGADPGTEIRLAARLGLVQLVRDKQLRVIVSQTFPLTDVAAAHRAIMTGHTRGKIALIP
jgi:NADPH:quinone reductase